MKKLIPESIGKEIEKQTQAIFPLKDCSLAHRNKERLFVFFGEDNGDTMKNETVITACFYFLFLFLGP